MASSNAAGHYSKRDRVHRAWSHRTIKKEREEAARETARRKLQRSQLRHQLHRLTIRHRRIVQRWTQVAVTLAVIWSFRTELQFQVRMQEFNARQKAFLARAEQATLEELTLFRHCGMKFPYHSQEEAEAHREQLGRQNLEFYRCTLARRHWHLRSPFETRRSTTYKTRLDRLIVTLQQQRLRTTLDLPAAI